MDYIHCKTTLPIEYQDVTHLNLSMKFFHVIGYHIYLLFSYYYLVILIIALKGSKTIKSSSVAGISRGGSNRHHVSTAISVGTCVCL